MCRYVFLLSHCGHLHSLGPQRCPNSHTLHSDQLIYCAASAWHEPRWILDMRHSAQCVECAAARLSQVTRARVASTAGESSAAGTRAAAGKRAERAGAGNVGDGEEYTWSDDEESDDLLHMRHITLAPGLRGSDIRRLKHAWTVVLCTANEIGRLLPYMDGMEDALVYVHHVPTQVAAKGAGKCVAVHKVYYVGSSWPVLSTAVRYAQVKVVQARRSGRVRAAPTQDDLFWKVCQNKHGFVDAGVDLPETLNVAAEILDVLLI